MYLLPYLPAVVSTPRGISTDTRRYAKGHSSAPFYERLAHRAPHIRCGSPRFRMSCVLCRDSLRGVSSVNLECCFVRVWPQRQTFVRILLHSRIGRLLRADVRRPPASFEEFLRCLEVFLVYRGRILDFGWDERNVRKNPF